MPTTWTAQKIHFLTQPELRSLFRVITRKRDRALFLLAYRHGLRASEVGLLHVDDLNFEQQRPTIHRVKRSLSGIYPLRTDEVTALKAYLRDWANGCRLANGQMPPEQVQKTGCKRWDWDEVVF